MLSNCFQMEDRLKSCFDCRGTRAGVFKNTAGNTDPSIKSSINTISDISLTCLSYLSYHRLKFMLPSISRDCMWVRSHAFSTSDLLFHMCIWIFVRFLHSTDVHPDRFNMLCNPSSFAPSLLPGHLMQHNESVADTLRWSLCQHERYGSCETFTNYPQHIVDLYTIAVLVSKCQLAFQRHALRWLIS